MSRALSAAPPLVALWLSVGCSAGGAPTMMMAPAPDGGSDAAVDMAEKPFAIGAFPSPPQVESQGGPVLPNPRIVPVFFANSDPSLKAALSDFLARLGKTGWWRAATEEYGVGSPTCTDPVTLAESANGDLTSFDIEHWLADALSQNPPLLPAADDNTVYVLLYPKEVNITLGLPMGGMFSCRDFDGFHLSFRSKTPSLRNEVAFIVIPVCPTSPGMTAVDAVTVAASHELVEAATDPYPLDDPAYFYADDAHFAWNYTVGGEVGDMCAQELSSYTKFDDLPYMVQRIWSNAAARAGHDPCVPVPASNLYFQAAPDVRDAIKRSDTLTVTGVQLAVGESKTIPLDLWSDVDTKAPWTVRVREVGAPRGAAPTLSLTLDKTSGKNGDKLNLTIKLLRQYPFGMALYQVTSRLNGQEHDWYGMVGP
jgi:hypothetical protein